MAIYKSDIVNIDLDSGSIFRSFLNNTIGTADKDANRFGVRVFRSGAEVDLSGCSCYGYFRDPQGNNIALTSVGTVSGNEAYITLPQACYNYEGQFCLAIKLIGGGVTGTVRIIDGVVDNTNTGSAVAPTSAVPTYTEILSQFDAMVAATAAANTAIAPTFAQGTAYAAGALVINDGALYALPNGHTAGTTWANTTKVATNLGDQVTSLKSALSNEGIVTYPRTLILGSTQYWAQPTGTHVMIEVATGDVVTVKANNSNASYFGFLKSYGTPVNGGAINYSSETGFTGRKSQTKGTVASYTVPSDVTCVVFNNYYTTSFLPSEVKINGKDVLPTIRIKLNTALLTDFTYAESVGANADFNTYTTPGNYYVATVAIAETISNIPVFGESYYGGRLTVETINSASAVLQRYEASAPARIAWRVYTSGAWSQWQYVATKSATDAIAAVVNSVESAKITSFVYATAIPSDSDMDDYTTAGNYYVATQAIANSISNMPVFQNGLKYAGRLTVTTINSANAIMQEYDAAQSSFRAWRKKTSSGWSVWYLFTTQQTVDGYKENSRAVAIGSFNAVRNVMKTTEYNMAYANAPIQMDFENYLGNTQNVHPKVLYFSSGFGGHKYWMAYTPYPFSNDAVENPCVAYSDDGYSWTNISANPLATADGGAYNSDTHLVYNGTSLECWYRRVGASVGGVRTETLYRRTTTDGVNWTTEQQVMFNDGTETGMGYSKLLSPAVIWDGSKYCMWVIANTTYIDYYESSNASDWTLIRQWKLKPRGEADIRFNEDDTDHTNTYPWHLDVIKDGSTYIMLIMCRNTTDIPGAMCSLFIITSSDNITYSENGTKVVGGSTDNWDKYMYRSSIVKIEEVYRIYYSAGSGGTSTIYNNAVWGLGVTESNSLSGFIGRLV